LSRDLRLQRVVYLDTSAKPIPHIDSATVCGLPRGCGRSIFGAVACAEIKRGHPHDVVVACLIGVLRSTFGGYTGARIAQRSLDWS
jgi:hypothetical protein